jgi:hypothetical protein
MMERTSQGRSKLRPPSVILSAAKDLRLAPREILRCAQDDSSASKNPSGACPRLGTLWGVACHKLGSIVTENELAILDMDHHIRLAVMMHVTEG